MTAQAALPFSQRAPKTSDAGVRALMALLQGRGWVIAKALPFNDRMLRALASASDGEIISGQLGYRLTREATIDEVNHAINFLDSQAAAMAHRAMEIRRAMHRRRPA